MFTDSLLVHASCTTYFQRSTDGSVRCIYSRPVQQLRIIEIIIFQNHNEYFVFECIYYKSSIILVYQCFWQELGNYTAQKSRRESLHRCQQMCNKIYCNLKEAEELQSPREQGGPKNFNQCLLRLGHLPRKNAAKKKWYSHPLALFVVLSREQLSADHSLGIVKPLLSSKRRLCLREYLDLKPCNFPLGLAEVKYISSGKQKLQGTGSEACNKSSYY